MAEKVLTPGRWRRLLCWLGWHSGFVQELKFHCEFCPYEFPYPVSEKTRRMIEAGEYGKGDPE